MKTEPNDLRTPTHDNQREDISNQMISSSSRREARLTVYRRLDIAKRARLGPAKSDELVTKFDRVDKVLLVDLKKTQREPCRGYSEY